MLKRKKNGLEWLEYELLAECPEVDFRVFLRHGGCSQGVFDSLNFGLTMGDLPESVAVNFEKIKNLLGCPHVMSANQKHGTDVVHITDCNKHEGHVCDVLTTQVVDLPLLVKHADCQAACFYDPINKSLAMVHCGWRGNVQDIYAKTIAFMQHAYSSQPANLLVCISPSLGPNHSEFINFKTEWPEIFWQFQHKPFYFDLWAISQWQLTNQGILPHHIQMANIDTWEEHQDYFSYRRSHPTGVHASIGRLINTIPKK